MDNLWFGIAVIATLAATGWYSGQVSTKRHQLLLTVVVSAIGVGTVAYFLSTVMLHR